MRRADGSWVEDFVDSDCSRYFPSDGSAANFMNAPATQARRGGRAVEGTGLENRQRRQSLVGSNPTPSARNRLQMEPSF